MDIMSVCFHVLDYFVHLKAFQWSDPSSKDPFKYVRDFLFILKLFMNVNRPEVLIPEAKVEEIEIL
jgi:hypothetical protein